MPLRAQPRAAFARQCERRRCLGFATREPVDQQRFRDPQPHRATHVPQARRPAQRDEAAQIGRIERIRSDSIDQEVPHPGRRRIGHEFSKRPCDHKGQHAPLNGGQLQPTFGLEPRVTEHPVDERVRQRSFQPEGESRRHSRAGELGDQPRPFETGRPPDHLDAFRQESRSRPGLEPPQRRRNLTLRRDPRQALFQPNLTSRESRQGAQRPCVCERRAVVARVWGDLARSDVHAATSDSRGHSPSISSRSLAAQKTRVSQAAHAGLAPVFAGISERTCFAIV